MAIEKLNEDLNFIAGLGTNPNTDNNLTAEELKALFDKASLIIQAYINGTLVPAINEAGEGVKVSGGTMSGNLDMNGSRVTGLPAPESDSDAVSLAYMLQKIMDVTGFSGEHKDLSGLDTADQHPMSAITGLVTALGGKAPYVHDHDGRYYTEAEVVELLKNYCSTAEIETLLGGYSETGHSHTAASVGAVPTAGGTMTGALTLKGNLILTEGKNYGTTAQRPAAGVKGRVYLRKAGS